MTDLQSMNKYEHTVNDVSAPSGVSSL